MFHKIWRISSVGKSTRVHKAVSTPCNCSQLTERLWLIPQMTSISRTGYFKRTVDGNVFRATCWSREVAILSERGNEFSCLDVFPVPFETDREQIVNMQMLQTHRYSVSGSTYLDPLVSRSLFKISDKYGLRVMIFITVIKLNSFQLQTKVMWWSLSSGL